MPYMDTQLLAEGAFIEQKISVEKINYIKNQA